MVRVFPSINSTLAADAFQWHGHPENNAPAFMIDNAAKAKFVKARLPMVCHHTLRSHPFGIFYGENPLTYLFPTFLLDVIIVILLIRFIRFLLKPLRQPRIVSELIGGVIVGPSILGQSRRFNHYIFPDTADYLIKNFGIVGFMYFLFISGVKTDLTIVKRAPRKHAKIAIASVIFPFVVATIVGFILRSSMDSSLSKISSIGGVTSSLAFTSFPVIYTVLKEFKLLNSELGKLAMSVAVFGDSIGINAILVFEAVTQGEKGGRPLIWYLISVLVLGAFMLTAVRRALKWIVDKTPQGKSVDQNFIVAILLGVMVMGFLTDMFGMAIANGPLWLGLIIPDGPPLGSTLVDRSETIIVEILMPFSFALVGLNTNVYLMNDEGWSKLAPLFAMTITGYVCKFLSTALAAFLLKMPVRDSFTLGLILNLRGQIEVLIYLHWMDKKMVGIPGFTLMVLHTLAMTAITAPFITVLYDPTRPYMIHKRRTIQHTPPCTDLGIVLAVTNQENLASLVSLLEFAYPTTSNPFSIFAIRLVELLGRASPIFIDHEVEEERDDDTNARHLGHDDSVRNALKHYQETRSECVKLRAYTALAPKRTMYQDICELALVNKTAFILLPYHSERLVDILGSELHDRGMESVNSDVLSHAPCSVGVYFVKGHLINPLAARPFEQNNTRRFVVLFLGGADNREALHFADRMTGNPDINLTVIRFLSHNYEGDNEMEKKLDDGVVTWFWVKNERNERVVYKEVVVKNGAETLAAIQAMNVNDYDMWITGRKQGINPKLVEGLSTWSNEEHLGVVGDCVATSDFCGDGSVLVVQQQVMGGQKRGTGFLQGKFGIKSFASLWAN